MHCDVGTSTQVNLPLSEVQCPLVPGLTVKLDQGGFNLWVAAHTDETTVPIIRRKRCQQLLDQPSATPEIRAGACPFTRYRRLEQVAGAVKFVTPSQVFPYQLGMLALEPRVEVAVRPLSACHEVGGLVAELVGYLRRLSDAVPGGSLQDLVDVGIREVPTPVGGVGVPAFGHTP